MCRRSLPRSSCHSDSWHRRDQNSFSNADGRKAADSNARRHRISGGGGGGIGTARAPLPACSVSKGIRSWSMVERLTQAAQYRREKEVILPPPIFLRLSPSRRTMQLVVGLWFHFFVSNSVPRSGSGAEAFKLRAS